jgi:hypothetical protein
LQQHFFPVAPLFAKAVHPDFLPTHNHGADKYFQQVFKPPRRSGFTKPL